MRARKHNPASSAAALSEAWHGRPAEKETEYETTLHTHEYLTDCGALKEIELHRPAGTVIAFGKGTRLASNEHGTQLFVEGGDQSIDLREFPHIDRTKESVVLGKAIAVTYITAKQHLGAEDKVPGPYRHEFGEEGGTCPTVIYDTMNCLLSFSGGTYHIDRDLDDGAHSAGVRN